MGGMLVYKIELVSALCDQEEMEGLPDVADGDLLIPAFLSSLDLGSFRSLLPRLLKRLRLLEPSAVLLLVAREAFGGAFAAMPFIP